MRAQRLILIIFINRAMHLLKAMAVCVKKKTTKEHNTGKESLPSS